MLRLACVAALISVRCFCSDPILGTATDAVVRIDRRVLIGFWCKCLDGAVGLQMLVVRDYAASTAVQISGIVVGRPGNLPILNCPS